MKQIKYIILVLLVCVLMWLPSTKVNADTVVCETEHGEYKTIKEAADDLRGHSGTITILCDFETSDTLEVNANITLDLAGHKVVFVCEKKRGCAIKIDSEKYTFQLMDSVGNGEIQCRGAETGIDDHGGTVIIQSGTISMGTPFSEHSNTIAFGVTGGNAIINGGTFVADLPIYATSYQRTKEDRTNQIYSSVIQINGGRFMGTKGCYFLGSVQGNINGGYFSGSTDGDYTDTASGLSLYESLGLQPDLTISGGEFHGMQYGFRIVTHDWDDLNRPETIDQFYTKYMAENCRMYKMDGSVTPISTVAKSILDPWADTINKCKLFGLENHIVASKIRSNVQFNANGGVVNVATKVVTYEDSYGELPTPTREGHTFLGWFTESIGGTQITDTTVVAIKADQSLYAHWQVNQQVKEQENKRVTVTFDANGGKKLSIKKKTVEYGTKFGSLPTVQKKGYSFAGWYTAKKGGSKVTSTTTSTLTKNTVLYAHWQKVTIGKTTLKSLSSKAGKVVAKYSNKKKVTGYQIVVCRNKKFGKGTKSYTTSKTSKTITRLKKGGTFYVRVRAYKVDSTKKKVYGAWSIVKKVKIK